MAITRSANDKGRNQGRSGSGSGSRLSPIQTNESPRIIIASDGLEKSGKSHFALTAPKPIAYFVLDRGFENVHTAGNKGSLNLDGVDTADYIPDIKSGDPNSVAREAELVWSPLVSDYAGALESKRYRTVVVDTGTEAWELLRLARFGKLGQVKSHHYGPVNAEMRRFIRLAYKSDKNVVFIHKLKEEYNNKMKSDGTEMSYKTGRLVRAGFSSMGFEVQMNITHVHESGGPYEVLINNCGLNSSVEGMQMEMSFADLAQQVHPDSDPAWWE